MDPHFSTSFSFSSSRFLLVHSVRFSLERERERSKLKQKLKPKKRIEKEKVKEIEVARNEKREAGNETGNGRTGAIHINRTDCCLVSFHRMFALVSSCVVQLCCYRSSSSIGQATVTVLCTNLGRPKKLRSASRVVRKNQDPTLPFVFFFSSQRILHIVG